MIGRTTFLALPESDTLSSSPPSPTAKCTRFNTPGILSSTSLPPPFPPGWLSTLNPRAILTATPTPAPQSDRFLATPYTISIQPPINHLFPFLLLTHPLTLLSSPLLLFRSLRPSSLPLPLHWPSSLTARHSHPLNSRNRNFPHANTSGSRTTIKFFGGQLTRSQFALI
jgi:hypothetical protein